MPYMNNVAKNEKKKKTRTDLSSMNVAVVPNTQESPKNAPALLL